MSDTENTATTEKKKVLTEAEQAARDEAAAFRKLPAHRQVQTRLARQKDRLVGHLEHVGEWVGENEGKFDEQVNTLLQSMLKLVKATETAMSACDAFPDDYKVSQSRSTSSLNVEDYKVGEQYKVIGRAAKDDPDMAKVPVTLLEIVPKNKETDPQKARISAVVDGDKIRATILLSCLAPVTEQQ